MLKFLAWTAALGVLGALGGAVYCSVTPKIYEAKATAAAVSTVGGHPEAEAAALLNQPQLQSKAASQTGVKPIKARATANEASQLVVLTVQAGRASDAQAFAQALLKNYAAQTVESNQKLASAKRTQLQQKAKAAQISLNSSEAQIAKLKEASGIIDMDATVQQAVKYQSLLAQQRDSANQDLASLNQQISSEMAQLQKMPGTSVGKVTRTANPVLKAYEDQLVQLQQKKISLLATWLETSEPVQGIDAQINAVKKEIAAAQLPSLTVETQESAPNPVTETLKQEIAQQRAQIASDQASLRAIEQTLASQKQQNKQLPAAQVQMIQLVRQRNSAQKDFDTYSDALSTMALTGIQGEMPTLAAVLPPAAGSEPVWPDRSILMSIGAAIGLVLGAAIGFGTMERERVFAPVSLGPQAFPMPEQAAALPPQTIAPPLPGRKGTTLSALASEGGTPAESYRYMVYSLSARHPELCRSVLFSGVTSDELCSEAAAQFAVAMAETGIRTLLADINFRKPDLTSAFGGKGKSGISDMLSRTMLPTPARDLLLETAHEGLMFLPCGSEEADGLGGCHNLQIAGLMEDFDSKADIRVYNAAACTVTADAPRLVRYVDEVCLVASASDEARGLVSRARSIMQNEGAKSIEVILVDSKRSRESFVG